MAKLGMIHRCVIVSHSVHVRGENLSLRCSCAAAHASARQPLACDASAFTRKQIVIGQRAASRRQRERGVGQRVPRRRLVSVSVSSQGFLFPANSCRIPVTFPLCQRSLSFPRSKAIHSRWIDPVDISSKCILCFAVKEGVEFCSLEANGRLSFLRVVLCLVCLCALLFRLFFRCALQ